MTTKAIPSRPKLLPPGQDFGATDEPIKADLWRNIDFTKDGRSFIWGYYPSEEIAKDVVSKLNAFCDEIQKSCPSPLDITNDDGRHCYWWPEYNHSIQVPWKVS